MSVKWTSHSETGTKGPRILVFWLVLVLAATVAVAGAVGLWNAVDVTLRGIPTTARVIEHEHRASRSASIYAQVEITGPGGRAFRTEVFDQFGVADWVDG